ncbi:MAG: hypothetical protein U9N85_08770 [Bacteroidota bacterium]|nr:hypothetical protein [Bacteroidota bacterium]
MNTMNLFNIRIDEPMAVITDLLVTAISLYAFFVIHNRKRGVKTFVFFKMYFLIMAVATALGGVVGHGFLYALSFEWKLPGWILSMISIALIERATIEHSGKVMPEKFFSVLKVVNIAELAIFITISMLTLNFFFVEIHSAYGLMFVVSSLEIYIYAKTKAKSSKLMLIGIGFAAVAALFFMNEISIHQWFNHLAMSHTLMAVASFFIFKGVMQIPSSGLYKTEE